jgi:hypothetical protein
MMFKILKLTKQEKNKSSDHIRSATQEKVAAEETVQE